MIWDQIDKKQLVSYKLRVDVEPSVNELLVSHGLEALPTLKEMREQKRRKESRSRSPSSKPTTPTPSVTNVQKGHLQHQPLGLKTSPRSAVSGLTQDLVPFAHKTIHPLMDNITELDSEGERSTVKCAPHAAGTAGDDQQSLLDLMNASRTELPMQREINDDPSLKKVIVTEQLDLDAEAAPNVKEPERMGTQMKAESMNRKSEELEKVAVP